jgi:phosphoglycerol transferase MdoB-like AlkP superfamily enzyme
MSKTTTATSSSGVSTSSLLGVAFVILKLTHVINWSWWWVLAPFWIPWAIIGAVLLVIGVVWLIVKGLDRRDAKRRAARRAQLYASRNQPRTRPRTRPTPPPTDDGQRLG